MNKEDVATTTTRIVLQKTSRFSVLHDAELLRNTPHDLPVLLLSDLLTHQRQKKTEQVQSRLWSSLREYGFVVLKAPRSSKPARVVEDMKQSLCQDFFPNQPTTRTEGGKTMRNPANLQSGEVYVSERGVPMWKVGYELCDDIREVRNIPIRMNVSKKTRRVLTNQQPFAGFSDTRRLSGFSTVAGQSR